MRHGSLFSGIGGFDLASEWMGWENIFHCEIEPFPKKILQHYWPNADSLGDIKKTDFKKYEGQIDIISGGFPCQPYSAAGKRKGKEDDRHLWPEMLRAIREIKPRWIVGENVYGLTNWNGGLVFEEVHTDLEAEGYEVWAVILPAVSKDAPHRRDRVWFIAYASSTNAKPIIGRKCREQVSQRSEIWSIFKPISQEWATPNANECERCKGWQHENQSQTTKRHVGKCNTCNVEIPNWEDFPTQSPICGRDDGISAELDGITFPKWRNESIKGYGNAVVPQVVFEIFKTIQCF